MEKEEAANKKCKIDDNDEQISLEDRVKNTTIPLWNMPYDNQVKMSLKIM